MEWSDAEYQELAKAQGREASATERRASIEAIASRAVELVAARGGTLSPDVLREVLAFTGATGEENGGLPHIAQVLRKHVSVQGARVAVLEKERDASAHTLLRERNESRVEAENLRERLSATEESNRELVRRAQQAEAERDAAVKLADRRKQERLDALSVKTTEGLSASEWVLRAGKAKRELDELKSRCTALSAAGQVLSEHVDKACGNCGGVQPETCAAHEEPMTERSPYERWPYPECYPCSSTCTHDDAKSPGHPERVKERSAMVTDAVQAGKAVVSEAYEQGAEAMRAACWEAVQTRLAKAGFTRNQALWNDVKSAIEGATP